MLRFFVGTLLLLAGCTDTADAPPGQGLVCRAGCSYACGSQCPDICGARECWTKNMNGTWQRVAVDCATNCNDQ